MQDKRLRAFRTVLAVAMALSPAVLGFGLLALIFPDAWRWLIAAVAVVLILAGVGLAAFVVDLGLRGKEN